MKGVATILRSTTKDGLLKSLRDIRSKKGKLTNVQIVAALNQCAVVEEAAEPGNGLVDAVMEITTPGECNDNMYRSMTRSYQRTGYPNEAISTYKCLSSPIGGDIAAAMSAAAAVGDSPFADSLWKAAHSANLIDTADHSHKDALRQLALHYVAVKIRSKRPGHTKQLLEHLSRDLHVEFDGESWQVLLAACYCKPVLDVVWGYVPSSCRTGDVTSAAAWTYLSVGSPATALALCTAARDEGIATLSHFCCAVESQLTQLHSDGRTDLRLLRENISNAAQRDASDEWLREVNGAVRKVGAA